VPYCQFKHSSLLSFNFYSITQLYEQVADVKRIGKYVRN
jgi:hypothetical protein